MSDAELAAKAEKIAIRASAIDSGASEEIFGGGTYGPDSMDIPALFRPFEDLPDREALRSHVRTLDEALGHLVYETQLDLYPTDGDDTYAGRPEFDAIESIAGEMNNWIGASADSFQDAVATPAPRIIPDQFWAARALKLALEAEASLWDAVQSDIHGIADQALNSLEHVEDKGPIGFNFTMTVVAAIVGVSAALSAPATGGASLALALAVWGRANLGHGVFHFAKPSLVSRPDFTGHI